MLNKKIKLEELIFYMTVKNDMKLTESELRNNKYDYHGRIDNYNKMKYNVQLIEFELPKVLKFANALLRTIGAGNIISIVSDKNECITFRLQSSEYTKIINMFSNCSRTFNKYLCFNRNESLVNGDVEYFHVTIVNRNIREKYLLLNPIYDKETIMFQYLYPMTEGIIFDVNDFKYTEEEVKYE